MLILVFIMAPVERPPVTVLISVTAKVGMEAGIAILVIVGTCSNATTSLRPNISDRPLIGSSPPEERYGSNVLLVSSGKAEWIQQMKERLGASGGAGKTTTTPAPVADAPYKSPSAKKLEREEREKQETDLIIWDTQLC
ncbi:hypothetical protein COOONC_15679 [Cooperia oncophora]